MHEVGDYLGKGLVVEVVVVVVVGGGAAVPGPGVVPADGVGPDAEYTPEAGAALAH